LWETIPRNAGFKEDAMCCLHSSHSPQSPLHDKPSEIARWWRVAFIVALAIPVALYLWTEQRVLLLGVLPYALFLLCPLMHLFLHRGHRGHRDSAKPENPEEHT
jgi:hypothetical protein